MNALTNWKRILHVTSRRISEKSLPFISDNYIYKTIKLQILLVILISGTPITVVMIIQSRILNIEKT